MASEGEPGFVYDAFGSHATDPDGDLLRVIESAVEGFHQRTDVPKQYLRDLQLCVDGRDFVFPRRGREQAAVTIETVVRAYQRRSRALVVFAGPQSRDHPWVNKEIEWWAEERPDGPVYFALTHGESPSDPSVFMPSALLARGGGDTTVFFDLRGYYRRQNLVQAFLSLWRGGAREQALRREARNWKSVRSFDEEKTKLVARLVSDATDNAVSVADLEAAYAKADRRAKIRRTVATTIVSMFLLAAIGFAGLQYLDARTRQMESLSRQLALTSREADGADQQILISLQAFQQAPTAEAFRTLYEQAVKWRNLERLISVGQSVEALAVLGGSVFAGLEDGSLLKIAPASGKIEGQLSFLHSTGRVTAMLVAGTDVWVGHEDGTLDVLRDAELFKSENLRQMRSRPPARPRLDSSILSLAATNDTIVAGTGDGEVVALDTMTGKQRWRMDEDATTRFAALAAVDAGRRILAGTQNGVISVLDAQSGRTVETIPGFEGGLTLIAQQPEDDTVLALSGYGLLKRLTLAPDGYRFSDTVQMPPLVTSSTLISSRRWLLFGDASGNLHLRESVGGEAGFGMLSPHRAVVRAVVDAGNDRVISASGDGTIGIWSVRNNYAPASEVTHLSISPSILRLDPQGRLVAAGTSMGQAGVWILEKAGWRLSADLIAESIAVGGPALVAAAPDPVPADGFVSLDDEIAAIEMTPSANAVAWITQAGGVLWRPLDGKTRLLGKLDKPSFRFALSADGSQVAVALENQVSIYDTKAGSGTAPATITAQAGVYSIAFQSDGQALAFGLDDGRIETVRIADRRSSVSVPLTRGPADNISYDAAGMHLIVNGAASGDRRVIVVDASDFNTRVPLEVRQAGGGVSAHSISPAGDALATGDQDGQLIIWDLEKLALRASLDSGGSYISALAFDPIQGRLIAASSTAGLLSWPMQPEDLIAYLCGKIGSGVEEGFESHDNAGGQIPKPNCTVQQ
ncbi:PQQ-binding-like beta-propeller repeat protein [Mesorhizobium sp. M0138]|uniref:outer membrane protein assembly factor BamB family protein n=1 Tax=Mesorhizobium sp. M0138 TaxID=2956891 RepID=UPI00333D186F